MMAFRISKRWETIMQYNNISTLSGASNQQQEIAFVIRKKFNAVLHQLEAGYTNVCSTIYWLLIIMWPMINTLYYKYSHNSNILQVVQEI